MKIMLRIALVIGIAIVLIGFFGFVMPSMIGLLIAVLLIISINDILMRRYRQATRSFNTAAEAVARQQGAISKVAMAFASRGPLSRQCYEYARRLLAGENPIDAATESGVPLQLTTAVAMTTSNMTTSKTPTSQNARTSKSIRQARQSADLANGNAAAMPAYANIMYLVFTAFVTCLVLAFLNIFVVPTMEKMLGEFGLNYPNAWLIVGGGPTQALLAVVILALLTLVPILTMGSFFGIPIPSWMPISPQVIDDRNDTLRGLADAIESGMTVDQALQLAARVSLKPRRKRKLLHANDLIRQGVSPALALRRSGWLRPRESDWLRGASADRGAELLHYVADQRVRDANANLHWLTGIVFPLLVVILGLAVMAYVTGFFLSLVSLISGLS
jgi:hypothetical protein